MYGKIMSAQNIRLVGANIQMPPFESKVTEKGKETEMKK